MHRDRVLVREPLQRAAIVGERVVHRAVLLRRLHALQPRGKAFHHVLLQEALAADAGGEALHRDRPVAQVGEHHVRHRVVVRRELGLRDPVVRKEHLLRMRDRDRLWGRGFSPVGSVAVGCRRHVAAGLQTRLVVAAGL